ncbi:MAG: HD domain-containing protein [Spirochaetota bacterium]|nr:MAG: HD domain-containing protein [Spirochaetota bacterium]
MAIKCPGSMIMWQPKPEIFRCQSCGHEVEIWTDEIKVTCRNCNQVVSKYIDMSCIEWCKLAKECVGEGQFNKYMKNRVRSVKEKLLQFLDEHFGTDIKRIEHAQKVLKYAEDILMAEDGDSHIVIPAAILHDVGNKENEEDHARVGADIARKLLLKHGFQIDHIDEICDIILHHHLRDEAGRKNYRIIFDADRLVNFKDEIHNLDKKKIESKINTSCLTSTGKELARKIYL